MICCSSVLLLVSSLSALLCKVELLAWRCQLLRVILTVFRSNRAALQLYQHSLHYELDETDPSLWGHHHEQYTILAKKSKKVHSVNDIVLPLIIPTTAATTTTPPAATIPAAASPTTTVVATSDSAAAVAVVAAP